MAGTGRPATSRRQTIGLRVQPSELAALDAWIGQQQDPKPSRPAAIRAMVRAALLISDRRTDEDRALTALTLAPVSPAFNRLLSALRVEGDDANDARLVEALKAIFVDGLNAEEALLFERELDDLVEADGLAKDRQKTNAPTG